MSLSTGLRFRTEQVSHVIRVLEGLGVVKKVGKMREVIALGEKGLQMLLDEYMTKHYSRPYYVYEVVKSVPYWAWDPLGEGNVRIEVLGNVVCTGNE